MWTQAYDPFDNMLLSVLAAAIPIVVLLAAIGILEIRAHVAALLGLGCAFAVVTLVFGMPLRAASSAALFGAAFGLMPAGWIILNVLFLYNLTTETGTFDTLRESIRRLSADPRIQLLFIAFALGAFFEGAAGFGTPVAVTAAMLLGLGFSPLNAAGLSLIANTAPVAFGGLGTPIIALAGVTGLDLLELSAMIGRQLPFFSAIIPFWLVWAYGGWKSVKDIWPAILVAGVSFAIPQYVISNFHGPWLVDVSSGLISILALWLFLNFWQPAQPEGTGPAAVGPSAAIPTRKLVRAWAPWLILSGFVFIWGVPATKAFLDQVWSLKIPVPGLHEQILKVPPVTAKPIAEAAVYSFNPLSANGTSILIAAILSGLLLGLGPRALLGCYARTIYGARYSLLTMSGMFAIGYLTRYAGTDATLGLAFAHAGFFYPFFGTLIGWIGVALTGSDTASNVLFGGLQRVTAEQLGLSPVLMASANSSGGVMGKMIDAQSIVVASTATKSYGSEGSILRYVFFHSVALAVLAALLVQAQAHVWPFTLLAP